MRAPIASTLVNDMLGTHGYMNFLQNSPLLSQNLHFVGGPSHYGPSNPPTRNERSPSVEEVSNPPTTGHHNLNVENEEVGRTDKRIKWTQDEDLRLMSAWLKNSVDSIAGNDRRNEQY
ncbi:hypothetical protein PVAP13_2NG050500 [Panicum virgatum]|uniref:Uncharacterized protein n=1 Tax=Panicum virgatum TaxID=38727 RepID=A0A8T0V631_PANVG|nr:hypothetical protein PVAP13_2NG050500 [Panicum virgatum]